MKEVRYCEDCGKEIVWSGYGHPKKLCNNCRKVRELAAIKKISPAPKGGSTNSFYYPKSGKTGCKNCGKELDHSYVNAHSWKSSYCSETCYELVTLGKSKCKFCHKYYVIDTYAPFCSIKCRKSFSRLDHYFQEQLTNEYNRYEQEIFNEFAHILDRRLIEIRSRVRSKFKIG